MSGFIARCVFARPGGSLIQQFCACTALVYTPDDSSGDGNATVVNSCRFLSPSGNYLNATSTLSNMGPAGHWTEKFDFPLAPAGSYNIIEYVAAFARGPERGTAPVMPLWVCVCSLQW